MLNKKDPIATAATGIGDLAKNMHFTASAAHRLEVEERLIKEGAGRGINN